MNQLILESSNSLDIQLLLSLARHLGVNVVTVSAPSVERAHKMAVIKQAAHDPEFLADVEAVQENFG